MDKDIIKRAKALWQDFLIKKSSEKKKVLFYILSFFVFAVILFEGIYLFTNKKEQSQTTEQKTLIREKNGLVISSVQTDGFFSDFSFESEKYNAVKNITTKNADAEISNEQFNFGGRSLKISWANGQDKTVRLNNYLVTQKDQFYKIGFWISSSQNSQVKLSLANEKESALIAEVEISNNPENKFKYYEYNFKSTIEASGLDFSVSGRDLSVIFIDDIKLLPLAIEKNEELSSVKTTIIGSDREIKIDQKQLLHPENSSALSIPRTMLGQIFVPQKSDLVGAEFFITKNGDGGVGDYAIQVREFDEQKQSISTKVIATTTFSAGVAETGNRFFQILAKLEVGKKYWLGLDNTSVKVSNENYLAIGQAKNNLVYPNGNGFMQRAENKIFTEEKDLYFKTYYVEPLKLALGDLPYGETIYDLGKGKSRLDFQLDSIDGVSVLNNAYTEKNTSSDKFRNPLLGGSSILDVYEEKNVSIDVWRNAIFSDNEAYSVYKINTNQKNIEKLILANLIFHYNLQLLLSVDGKLWTEIYSNNPEQLWQNSGKIEVTFKNSTQNIFMMLKRKGTESGVFLGGYFMLDLIDQTYDK